jgi:hypothetical protein
MRTFRTAGPQLEILTWQFIIRKARCSYLCVLRFSLTASFHDALICCDYITSATDEWLWSSGWVTRTLENRSTWRKICSSATSYTTNTTCSGLGSNTGPTVTASDMIRRLVWKLRNALTRWDERTLSSTDTLCSIKLVRRTGTKELGVGESSGKTTFRPNKCNQKTLTTNSQMLTIHVYI